MDFSSFEPSFWSLAPALTAILLAFLTRRVIPSLFAGVVLGGVVLSINTGELSDANFLGRFMLPALGTTGFAKILIVYLWSLGGLTGLWGKTGGAQHFAEVVGGKLARGPRSSLFFGWLIGVIFHQGGTVSTVLAGTTVKPVTDKHNVAHEELAYVVDSTASPVATILPFNAWPAFVGALVVGTIPLFPDEDTARRFFFASLPYNFYAILALVGTLLFSLHLLPWLGGRMSAARKRSRTAGKLDSDHARPLLVIKPDELRAPDYDPSLWDFLTPLGVLLGMAIIPYVFWGADWINEAFVSSVLSAMLVARIRGMKLADILDGFVQGCQSMTVGALVLALAVTLGAVAKELNTASYLVTIVGESIPLLVLPGALMALCMGIAFSTGTSWGTYAVVFPVAMPLAFAVNQDPFYIQVCFGAVLGGAVFGDQCSPISDTTILSSMFTGCDLMDHVWTQAPLALVAAGLGALLSTLTLVIFL